MTKYEVYEWLNRPTKLTYDIKAKIRLAEEIRSGLLPTAIRYDKDKIMTSYGTNADPMTEILARVEAIQKEIAELQLQRAIAMIELEEVFSKLDEDEGKVMSRYYLSRKKIEEIHREIHYSTRWVYKLRERGIEDVKNLLNSSQEFKKYSI
jgi:DNA-directed RNA polymerase specialized sigma subunit